MEPTPLTTYERYSNLFVVDRYQAFNPPVPDGDGGKMKANPGTPVTGQFGEAEFSAHIAGEIGIAGQALLTKETVRWAAIDVDYYNEDTYTHILYLIQDKGMPLIPCWSKSGNLHIYLFLSEEIGVQGVVDFLGHVANLLGLNPDHTELRPLQTKAGKKGNSVPLNLPYFGDVTGRVTKSDGIGIEPIESFLDEAESKSLSGVDFKSWQIKLLFNAPACVMKYFHTGEKEGTSTANYTLAARYLFILKQHIPHLQECIEEITYAVNILLGLTVNVYNLVTSDAYPTVCDGCTCRQAKNQKALLDNTLEDARLFSDVEIYGANGDDGKRYKISYACGEMLIGDGELNSPAKFKEAASNNGLLLKVPSVSRWGELVSSVLKKGVFVTTGVVTEEAQLNGLVDSIRDGARLQSESSLAQDSWIEEDSRMLVFSAARVNYMVKEYGFKMDGSRVDVLLRNGLGAELRIEDVTYRAMYVCQLPKDFEIPKIEEDIPDVI